MAERERSTKDIREDIAKEEESISQTVEKIGERITAKLDWRVYVKDSPYWTLGAAAGLGYFASRLFLTRTTPLERIMDSIAGQVHDSRSSLLAGATGPSLIRTTLLGIAMKAAADWIKNTAGTADGPGPGPQTGGDSTINTSIDTK
jgi:hypothetical protein